MLLPDILGGQERTEGAVAIEEAAIPFDRDRSVVPPHANVESEILSHADVVLDEHPEEIAANLKLVQAEVEEGCLGTVDQNVIERVVAEAGRIRQDATSVVNAEEPSELHRMTAAGLGEVLLEGRRRPRLRELSRLACVRKAGAEHFRDVEGQELIHAMHVRAVVAKPRLGCRCRRDHAIERRGHILVQPVMNARVASRQPRCQLERTAPGVPDRQKRVAVDLVVSSEGGVVVFVLQSARNAGERSGIVRILRCFGRKVPGVPVRA